MSVLVKRDSALNSIKRSLIASKKAEIYDEANLESYFVLLNQQWQTFCTAQDAVDLSCGIDNLQVQEAEREQGEEWYREAFANFTRAANTFKTTNTSKSDNAQQRTRADIKLPPMDLPHFSGDPKEWRPFRDAFTSFIHSETNISGALKLHYLRCSLRGEALNVIKAFPITDVNYSEAWKLLKKRYDVERVIVDSHFRSLFSIPKVNSESSAGLKALLDSIQEHYQSLKALGRPVANWDDWLVHLTVSKLDTETHRQWELSQEDDKVADFNTLVSFMETRSRCLDAISSNQQTISNFNVRSGQTKGKGKHGTSALHTAAPDRQLGPTSPSRFQKDVCTYCSAKYRVHICDGFRNLDVGGRVSFVQKRNLCTNCLTAGHDYLNCRSKNNCRVCQARHHTLLHREAQISATATAVNSSTPLKRTSTKHQVLLGTAVVKVMDRAGTFQLARLLFDNGSHLTFVTESCAQRLRLRRAPSTTTIEGIGGTAAASSKGEVQINISSFDESIVQTVRAQILPKITNNIPSIELREVCWPHIEKLRLADPQFHTPAAIDILIGADEVGQFLRSGLIKGSIGTPCAQLTTLGWVLFGKIDDLSQACTANAAVCMFTDTALTKAVSKFWQIESIPEVKHLTIEEKLCEKHFDQTHFRQEDGRYVVKLPFKPDCPLGDSRRAAVSALLRMESLFAKDEDLRTQYIKFIHEFIELGHMEETHPISSPAKYYYMPHRAVIKETSTTTKLRVVFNASCRTSTGFSLNDSQMIGPQLQPDLFSTLLRLRTHRFAMCADIAKMYRQVRIDTEHLNYQRIVWRDSPEDDIKDYRLLTVTYGVASASHLAVKALQQTAIDEGQNYQLATQVILRDFYMDDLLTGCFEEADLHRLRVEISTLLNRGGFHLRKWSSNSPLVISSIPEDQREAIQSKDLSEADSVRTLGLQWEPSSDNLTFTVQVHKINFTNLTKRLLLADASKLFDPLGLLSPSTIIPKILFQRLWRPKVDWDETVPHDIERQWFNYREHITSLAAIKVPRWVGTGIPNAITDLHGFADASQSAYAAVVYARTVAPDGNIYVYLLTAKTRVAPLKYATLSLPRLELCAAALLAQLITHIRPSLQPHVRNVYGWTDSSVALAWIRQPPGKWSTFVANRVSQVQEAIPSSNWFHVLSPANPADCATRGISPQHLINHSIWWNGPPWLKQPETSWPPQQLFTTNLDQRSEPINLVRCSPPPPVWEIIDRYSSLTKLKRVTAYVLRFTHNVRAAVAKRKNRDETNRQNNKHLHLYELNEALTLWIKITQQHSFAEDIERIQSKKHVSPQSKILRLHPFLDEKGLLRVGGRLCNSQLRLDKKYPVLLPANAKLTKLICEDIHKLTLHAGPQTMQAMLQSRFWVVGARKVLRKISRTCVKCLRYSHAIQRQLMGNLPKHRVEVSRAFYRTGVDFAGPVRLRLSKGRGSKAVKGYVAVFICMSTAAIHLELASDLSTGTFIAAFKRFVSRRGQCGELYSDNGTNFVGAEKELRTMLATAVNDDKLAKHLADDGTVWCFNPPAAPHMGGYWEAAVKRLKFHLRRTVGDNLLTYEEFTTLLTEIEACVNSRPLCPMSSDANDLAPLTPGHFLIGEPLKTIPEPSAFDFKGNILNRWQLLTNLRQHFWRRWSSEYLVQLQQRAKWTRSRPNFRIDDLMVIRDETLPPAKWKLGRIILIHPGSDGKVRVVTLKTADGTLKRPVVKLSPLLFKDEDNPEHTT